MPPPLPPPPPRRRTPVPDLITAEALICRAIQAQAEGKDEAAAQSFEEAANASPDSDPAKARMLAAAGNMWLSAGQAGKAALALDRALAVPGGLEAEQRGEALLDRARAAEAQSDLKTARAKLNEAAASISDDPFYWYFSAAVAVRENDAATAQSAINKALAMAPADASILFEAGHVAALHRRRCRRSKLLAARGRARPPRPDRQGGAGCDRPASRPADRENGAAAA